MAEDVALATPPDRPVSIYVHLPFCARLCPYCHFHVQISRDAAVQRTTVDAVAREFELYRDAGWFSPGVATLYLGGGTPSALRGEARQAALAWLGREVAPHLVDGAEVTLEANPEDVTPEMMAAWTAAGINRLSLGIQGHDADTLNFLGRTHDVDLNRRALAVAAAGVDNVSVDFMVGTPGADWSSTARWLEALVDDRVAHVSAYLLEIHPGTRFARDVDRGRWTPAPDDQQRDVYLRVGRWLAEHGLAAYELSNYARPGHTSQHNARYWRREPYVGLGPSAHSFCDDRRWWNLRGREYLDAVSHRRRPVESGEILTPEQADQERLLLGLRTLAGVPAALVSGRDALLRQLAREGLVDANRDRIRLTPSGWLVMDQIVAQLTR